MSWGDEFQNKYTNFHVERRLPCNFSLPWGTSKYLLHNSLGLVTSCVRYVLNRVLIAYYLIHASILTLVPRCLPSLARAASRYLGWFERRERPFAESNNHSTGLLSLIEQLERDICENPRQRRMYKNRMSKDDTPLLRLVRSNKSCTLTLVDPMIFDIVGIQL